MNQCTFANYSTVFTCNRQAYLNLLHGRLQIRWNIKTVLQEIISRAQENSVVRKMGGQALAATAKSALPAEEWPDFFPWLHDASKSPDRVHRELALMVFASLMSYLGGPFCHSPSLFCVLQKTLLVLQIVVEERQVFNIQHLSAIAYYI